MNLVNKDRLMMWRSPGLWLMLAVISFLMAWVAWQMVDRYNAIQSSLMQLPNPPTITQHLWVPMMLLVVKLSLLLVAYSTGLAIAKERSQQTIWYLLINHRNESSIIWAKFKAQMVLLIFVMLHVGVMTALLSMGGQLHWLQVASGLLGMLLLFLWFTALGLLLSCHCQNTGTAVLVNVVVFVMLWVVGGPGVGNEYGLNWLALISPAHHLQWLMAAEVGLSSLLYFVLGTGVFLWLAAQQIKHMRKQL